MLLTNNWGHTTLTIHDCYTQKDTPWDLRLTTQWKESQTNAQSMWGDDRLGIIEPKGKTVDDNWGLMLCIFINYAYIFVSMDFYNEHINYLTNL